MPHRTTARRSTALLCAAVLGLGLAWAPQVAAAPSPDPTAPTGLTVGQLARPVDLEALSAPLLGWQLRESAQTAYEVEVADTAAALAEGTTVWDSGKVVGAQSTNVAYAGPALSAAERYAWRVRTWDGERVSPWSAPSEFGTALSDGWGDAVPVWAPTPTPWTDYTLETTFSITTQNATVVLRAKDATNYLMWQFRSGTPATFAPHTRVGGTFTVLGTVPLAAPLLPGTDHSLKVSAVGDRITTWLDGVEIDSRTVPGFASGSIGFRTGGSERNAWDDLTVTEPGGRVLYSNDFSAPTSDFPCASVSAGRLTVGTSQNCVYAAGGSADWAFLRGEVDLAPGKDVAWATLYATASSPNPTRQYVYKASVNGTFVGLGPTMPLRDETRYDGFDVTALLRAGERNTVGALAYTTSDQRFLARLVVEYADGTRQAFGTGAGWTALRGGRVFPPAGSIGTSYFTAPKEDLQAAQFPTGFDTPGFDDAGWDPAQVKAPYASLAATPTAKVEQQLQRPVQVVEKSPGHYFVDYGRTWTGGVSLDVVGRAGQVLDLRFGEVLSAPQTVRYALNTGNTYQDRWTLRDGPQHLETWGMRVFRYVEVLGAPTGLTADDFPALAQVYPFDRESGVFTSSDDALNAVWQLSKDTIEATNGNLYVDSWTRERDAYEADSYLQMLANFFLSEDPTLGNYSIEHLLNGRTWPTEWPMYVILAMHDSYQQTGDVDALARNYALLQDKLPTQWVEASTGLIRKDTGSNGCNSRTDCDIVDWPASERDGYVFRPYNTVINAIGYRSFADMAAIASALGRTSDADAYAATAQRLRTAMNERLFDEAKGAYRDGLNADGTPVDHFAVQASVFATAFGVPDAARAARAADYIGTRGMACSVYCAAFVLEMLYNGDRADVAYDLLTSTGLRSWRNMIADGAGATAEAWDASLKPNLTYSHPWAASPAYNVPQGMFGIRPTTPGYATFDVKPQPDRVEWAAGTLPTLKGRIAAAFHTVGDRTDVGVHVPGNTVARVFLPGVAAGTDTVYVDGRPRPAVLADGYLRVDGIAPGCHVLSTAPGSGPVEDARLTGLCVDGYDVPDLAPPVLEQLPAVSVTATGADGAVVTYALPTATDAVDGRVEVACVPASGSRFPLGTTAVTCTAQDQSGNVATSGFAVDVTYAWSGFLQPLAGEDTPVVRAGATVPVRFALTGASAGTADARAVLTVARVTDGQVGPERPAGDAAGAGFRYDAAEDQYVLPWSTRGLEAGTYQLRVDLGDGVARTVRVVLR